ncbi:hypothetical protein KKF84_04285 [Myxococcota bacterium]|nr:hypothetical protein [Myxococcota bacterium]
MNATPPTMVPSAEESRWPMLPAGPRVRDSRLEAVSLHRIRLVRTSKKLLLLYILFFPIALIVYALMPLFITLHSRAVVTVLFPLFLMAFLLFSRYLIALFPLATFDKKTGRFVMRGAIFQPGGVARGITRLPLEAVRGVQFLEKPGGSTLMAAECNLLLENGKRINLLNHAELADIADEGQQLADFLGVPLLAVHHSPAPNPQAAPVN